MIGISQISDDLHERNRMLDVLSQAATRLLESPPLRVDFAGICDLMRELTKALLVVISTCDERLSFSTVEAFSGAPNIWDRAAEMLGFSPFGVRWVLDGISAKLHMSGQPVRLDGLHELTYGHISRSIGHKIETVLGIGPIYGIGLVHQGRILGSLGILMPIGHDLIHQDIVAIFAKQVAAAVLRSGAEQALHQNRERYQQLFEHSRDAVFLAGPDMVYLDVNPAACHMLGYNRDELHGMRMCELAPPGRQESLRCSVASLLRDGTLFSEIQLQTKDGRIIPTEINATVLPDGSLLGTVRDLTERKRIEEAQREKDEAEERERTRVRFLQMAAHELRNPMAGIKGILGLIRRRAESGRIGDGFDREVRVMEHEVDRLSSLLTEILDAFRAQEGRLAVKKDPVNLAGVIEAALAPFSIITDKHRFVVRLPGNSVTVAGDFQRLEEVLRNLLGNAVKYSPSGGTIGIRLSSRRGRAVIAVHDRGIGIPQSQIPHVFEGFFRGSNIDRANDPGGLGLGLFICHEIIQSHEGRIWVRSIEGLGATFYVELPLSTPPEMDVSEGPPGTG